MAPLRKYSVWRLASGGLFAALILLLTFAIKIPVPATGGYIHPGDGAIFYAGVVLGPYAGIVAGVGSALADLLGGYAIFALPTLIIKGVMGLIAGIFAKRAAPGRNALVFTLAALWMVGGYFLVEWVLFGLPAAIAAAVPNLVQGAGGVVFGLVLSLLPLPAGVYHTKSGHKPK